jgi:hypothetical protein
LRPIQLLVVAPGKGKVNSEFLSAAPYTPAIAVVGVDVAFDRVLQIVDGMEGPASDLAACDGGEEAFDGVEPRRRGRREMESPARMVGEPFKPTSTGWPPVQTKSATALGS